MLAEELEDQLQKKKRQHPEAGCGEGDLFVLLKRDSHGRHYRRDLSPKEEMQFLLRADSA